MTPQPGAPVEAAVRPGRSERWSGAPRSRLGYSLNEPDARRFASGRGKHPLDETTIAPIGLERLDELRPLWLALHQHHRDLGSTPLLVDDAASWRVRRDLYRALLADDRGFLLGAFAGAEIMGYVAIRLSPEPDDTFPIGDCAAEIYSLVVAAEARGRGVGSLLLDAADERLAALGITATSVAAMVENAEAIRLYRRRGFTPREIVLWRFRTDSGGDAGEDDA